MKQQYRPLWDYYYPYPAMRIYLCCFIGKVRQPWLTFTDGIIGFILLKAEMWINVAKGMSLYVAHFLANHATSANFQVWQQGIIIKIKSNQHPFRLRGIWNIYRLYHFYLAWNRFTSTTMVTVSIKGRVSHACNMMACQMIHEWLLIDSWSWSSIIFNIYK